jgi:hypothetical protein
MRSFKLCFTLLAALPLGLCLSVSASAQSCPVNATFNGSIGIGDPVQDGRIARVNPPSDCGGPKPYPGTVDNVPRRFDQYNFTNTSAAPACIRVTINPSGCGGNEIFSAAYLGSFNFTDVSQNYLGDSGDTPPGQPLSYSFTVPAGASFVIVVHEVERFLGCPSYTMTVDCGTPGAGAGQVLISEFRLSGPGLVSGDGVDERDEFIDLYNNTDAPILVGRYSIRAHDPAFGDFEFPIPPGTTIPARGHLLIGDSVGYSLPSYATLDIDTVPFFDGDVFIDNEGFQLIGPPGNNAVIDSVGFAGGGNAAQYIEGTGLARRSSTPDVQYSYVRKMCDHIQGVGCQTPGLPKDTNNNAADFQLISVTAETFSEAGPSMLGGPGPENLNSPRVRNNTIALPLLNPAVPSSSEPNRVRNHNPEPNAPLGTLSIQRNVVNNTGAPVTRLRFRVVEFTTINGPQYADPAWADTRVINSSGVVTRTDGTVVTTTLATTVEQPPVQPIGGGYNSTIVVGTVTSSTPIPPGGSIPISFRLGVVRPGLFRILVNIEALP